MGAFRALFVSAAVLLALIALVFSILPLIAGLNTRILEDWYWVRINTTNLVSESATSFATLINAVAERLGLQNYYQSGLWNYCSGGLADGSSTLLGPVLNCSSPAASYWFNPVQIIENDLPSSFTFSVPQSVIDDLSTVRIAQTWLKAILIVGCIFNFFAVLGCSCGFNSRMGSLCGTLVAFIAALFNVTGAILGQILGIVLRNVINGIGSVSIVASLGTKFYVFLWISAAASLLCFLLVFCTVCCCAPSRRGAYAEKRV